MPSVFHWLTLKEHSTVTVLIYRSFFTRKCQGRIDNWKQIAWLKTLPILFWKVKAKCMQLLRKWRLYWDSLLHNHVLIDHQSGKLIFNLVICCIFCGKSILVIPSLLESFPFAVWINTSCGVNCNLCDVCKR